jgi:hypothetical protein
LPAVSGDEAATACDLFFVLMAVFSWTLEREERPAARRHAGVVEARDLRMLERGQDVALARHPRDERGAQPRAARKFQRDLALQQTVGALGQPYGAHAARADTSQQPVGAHGFAGVTGLGRCRRSQRRDALSEGIERTTQAGDRFEEPGCLDRGLLIKQRADARLQRLMVRAKAREPTLTIFGRKIERFVEQPGELRPPVRTHDPFSRAPF